MARTRILVLLSMALIIAALLSPSLALAANNPGHDSLYVLKFGDSNVVGSINITNALNATNIYSAALLYGDQLDIRANSSIFSVSSRPAIQADASNLYLDSPGRLLINTRGGTTNVIQIGPTSGSSITLNVSGTIKQQNVNVCLSNGTNCPGSLGSANITGSGSANTVPLWSSGTNLGNSIMTQAGSSIQVAGILNTTGNLYEANNRVCTAANGLCASSVAYQSSAAGWTNTSTTTSTALNVSVTGNLTLGTGTSNQSLLFIRAQPGVGAPVFDFGNPQMYNQFIIRDRSYATATYGLAAGGLYVGESGNPQSIWSGQLINNHLTLWDSSGQTELSSGSNITFVAGSAERIRVLSGGNVGINTSSPQNTLEVRGTINASTIKVGTTNVCLADGTNCPAQSVAYQSSAGGWTNDSTTTRTTLQAIVNSSSGTGSLIVQNTTGSTHLLVNGSSGNVAFGTSAPTNLFEFYKTDLGWRGGLRVGDQSNSISLTKQWNDAANGFTISSSGPLGFATNANTHPGSGDPTPLMLLDNSGNLGIGATDPQAKFHVQDGAVLFNGTTGATPASGGGSRMMWIPAKAAFRAGNVTGTNWDDSMIDYYTIAMGLNTIANGTNNIAMGRYANATARSDSIAIGAFSSSHSVGGVALGYRAVASGGQSTMSFGYYTNASGYNGATALAYNTSASGNNGVMALGMSTRASGTYGSIALGYFTTASGANGSVSMGKFTEANGATSFAIGSGFNDTQYLNNTISHSLIIGFQSTTPTMFVNGSAVGIGTTVPNSKLEIVGNVTATGNIYAAGSQVCTAANGLCASGASSTAAGWTNTSTQVSLSNSANNLSADTLFVDNTNDRVGIGSTVPSQKLDVEGNARFNGYAIVTGDLYFGSYGYLSSGSPAIILSGYSGNYKDVALARGSSTEAALYLNSTSDSIGVGLTRPWVGAKFQVRNGTDSNLAIGGPQSLLNGTTIHSFNDAVSENRGLELRGNPIVLSTGNVGIGTTVPSYKLYLNTTTMGDGVYINGHAAAPGLFFGINGTQNAAIGIAYVANQYTTYAQPGDLTIRVRNASNSIHFSADETATYPARMTVMGSGNVGINTMGPQAKLHVNATSGDLILATNSSGNVFKVANNGEVFSDVAFTTPAADLAERIPVSGDAEPGDVLVIDTAHDERLVKSTRAYDRLAAGIVSTQPGLKLGSSGEYVALAGRVPVKVMGEVRRGDLLVTSDVPGRAMACDDYARCAGAVIGKAMTNAADGEVIALVSLQ